MKNNPKIVIIGAGSASFGLENLSGIISHENLKEETQLTLVDTDKNNLKTITALADRIKSEWNSNIDISSTTDRKETSRKAG